MPNITQKEARAKWDKNNMTSITCRVTKIKAKQFRDACTKLGLVPHQVLMNEVNKVIKMAEEDLG